MKLQKTFIVSALVMATSMFPAYADQVCSDKITATTPTSRFIDLGNGEVEDSKTGLVWQRCSLGQTWDGTTCTGEASQLTWKQALDKAKSMGNGYRLPTVKESMSITENRCDAPALNAEIFANTPRGAMMENIIVHWTSTPVVTDGNQAIAFNHGNGSYFIYPSKANQNPDMMQEMERSLYNKDSLLMGGEIDMPVYAFVVRTKK